MGHLRRLGIQNFRSIERANLKLGEITVVIGPSDSGKSNLVRALKAWSYNALSSGFTTEGFKICRVAVAVGAKHKIVFEKAERGGKQVTKYGRTRFVLVDSDLPEPISFEKVGRSVPTEIVDITKIRPIVIDDLKVPVHFAEQAEAWFLLANPPWTPGATSKVIGRVSGVDALILANRDLVNKRNRLTGEIKTLDSRADENRGRLGEFDILEDLARILAEAEAISENLEESRGKLRGAIRLGEQVKAARASMVVARARAEVLAAVVEHVEESDLEARLETVADAVRIEEGIDSLEARLRRAENKSRRARDMLAENVEKLAALAKDDDLECPLCGGEAHPACRKALAAQAKWAKVKKGQLHG